MINTVPSFSYFSDVASPEIEGLGSIVIRIRIERLKDEAFAAMAADHAAKFRAWAATCPTAARRSDGRFCTNRWFAANRPGTKPEHEIQRAAPLCSHRANALVARRASLYPR